MGYLLHMTGCCPSRDGIPVKVFFVARKTRDKDHDFHEKIVESLTNYNLSYYVKA